MSKRRIEYVAKRTIVNDPRAKDLRVWVAAMLVAEDIPARVVADVLDVSTPTALAWARKYGVEARNRGRLSLEEAKDVRDNIDELIWAV